MNAQVLVCLHFRVTKISRLCENLPHSRIAITEKRKFLELSGRVVVLTFSGGYPDNRFPC